ncbi:MAG: permease prefix domain 2-containing transporter, partial [Bacteroidota bacterium]
MRLKISVIGDFRVTVQLNPVNPKNPVILYQPPKYAQKFLQWFLKPELEEEVLGDLAEKFEQNLTTKMPFKAKVNYWYQTINYLRPFAIKNNIITDLNPFFMWQHHLKITFRKFQRNKTSFAINLIGLSTGLACALLIFMWVQDEWHTDKFHEKGDQLYEVAINATMPRGIQTWGGTPGPLAAALKTNLPEVETAISIHNSFMQPQGVLMNADKKLSVNGMYARPNFFEVFTYPLIEGTKGTVLKDKNGVVLTEATATKLFGSPTEAMDKIVTWKNDYFEEVFQVKGVCENPPNNATNQF